jgi:hypothetical protein
MLELTWNREILTCGTAMCPEREKSRQYLVWPTFVQNGPSEELPTQLFKWHLLQATKVPVSLWQGTRWPQTKLPHQSTSRLGPRGKFDLGFFPRANLVSGFWHPKSGQHLHMLLRLCDGASSHASEKGDGRISSPLAETVPYFYPFSRCQFRNRHFPFPALLFGHQAR